MEFRAGRVVVTRKGNGRKSHRDACEGSGKLILPETVGFYFQYW